MAQTTKNLPHICLDGSKWFPCPPAGEFGFLGDRSVCELSSGPGQSPKKILLRPVSSPQDKKAIVTGGNNLQVEPVCEDIDGLELRPFLAKTYSHAIPAPDGKLRKQERSFLQQDITGLITLRQAILKVVKDGSPRKVWHLFYSACKALHTFGKSCGDLGAVPLQCPNGLAVDAQTGEIVILDAEIKIPIHEDSIDAQMTKWFGPAGKARYAKPNEAAVLHSKALLLFFREVLGSLPKQVGTGGDNIPKLLVTQLEEIAAAKSVQEVQNIAENLAEDWSINSDMQAATPSQLTSTAPLALRPKTERTWFAWFMSSFFANILLAILVLLLAGLWLSSGTRAAKKGDGQKQLLEENNGNADGDGKNPIPVDSSMQFSSYCVVFPVRGTSSEKVLTALKQLYPDKVLAPKQGETERNKLLTDRLELAVKSMKDIPKIQQLLTKLNADHGIRFNGLSPEAGDMGLQSIVANGGLYRITSAKEKVQHDSLLRANAVDRLVAIAGMDENPEARLLLSSLKNATHKYASIKDAITIIGDRTAFILEVEPTSKAHEAVRSKLLGLDGTPVFVPRPVFELFDAVDPAAGTGGGAARYSLKLDTKCDWRQVSMEDRRKTDFQGNETNSKMQWQTFKANHEIVWTQLPVLRVNGRTDNVSSFDIAIPVSSTKVVVFRNQSILLGESKDQVLKQARAYLDRVLGLRNVALDDAVTVRQQEERFTGALLYNYLAEQATAQGEDLEIISLADFERLKVTEDKQLNK